MVKVHDSEACTTHSARMPHRPCLAHLTANIIGCATATVRGATTATATAPLQSRHMHHRLRQGHRRGVGHVVPPPPPTCSHHARVVRAPACAPAASRRPASSTSTPSGGGAQGGGAGGGYGLAVEGSGLLADGYAVEDAILSRIRRPMHTLWPLVAIQQIQQDARSHRRGVVHFPWSP